MKEETTDAVKPPLTLADLTEEQAIQVARLALGDAILMHSSNFRVRLRRGRINVRMTFWNHHYLESMPSEIIVCIYPNWTVHSSRVSNNEIGRAIYTSNQRAIQKLFTEWGAE